MAVFEQQATKKPPIYQIGIIHWLKENLFSTPINSVLTLFALYFLYLIIPPLADWIFFDATFSAVPNDQCSKEGACWSYIRENINLFAYGFYPSEEYWRPLTVLGLVIACVLFTRLMGTYEYKFKIVIAMVVILPVVAFFLLYGGLGLEVVETHKWGGLMLTIVISVVGMIASFPLGIMLALGRKSEMKIIRFFCIIYIEFFRGVPLITILFMASVVLPLFFAEGVNFDKLMRALIGITLFQTAYFAEVIRGGLQAIPKGQYEAADAIGLSYFQKTILIVLPQALKISIPNIVGFQISFFKDTTLVLIIGLFDMLAIVGLSSSDENWLGNETEGYVFVMIVFWVILYSWSRYSKTLEKRFNTEQEHQKA